MSVGAQYFTSSTTPKMTCIWPPNPHFTLCCPQGSPQKQIFEKSRFFRKRLGFRRHCLGTFFLIALFVISHVYFTCDTDQQQPQRHNLACDTFITHYIIIFIQIGIISFEIICKACICPITIFILNRKRQYMSFWSNQCSKFVV